MDLVDVLGAIGRRWFVVVVGLAGLFVLGAYAVRDVPTHYESSGQLLLLLPPAATGDHTPTSPFLNAPGGLTTAASVIATEASSLDAQRELAAQGYEAKYSASVFPNAGPVVAVTSTGTDPAVVVATRDAVMQRLGADLARIQHDADVPDNQLIYANTSSADRGAEVLPGSKKRALLGITGAGGLLLVLLLAALDRASSAVRSWRRRRRDPAPHPPAEELATSGAGR